ITSRYDSDLPLQTAVTPVRFLAMVWHRIHFRTHTRRLLILFWKRRHGIHLFWISLFFDCHNSPYFYVSIIIHVVYSAHMQSHISTDGPQRRRLQQSIPSPDPHLMPL